MGHQGALGAWGALSGSQREEGEEEGHRHSLVEAWEVEVLSYLDASDGPSEVHMALWGACPCVGGCQGEEGPDAGLIQAVVAPSQEGREAAWASAPFLGAFQRVGRAVARVEVPRRHPGALAFHQMGAFACQGASRGAWNLEGVREETHREEACLALASRPPLT